MKPTLILALIMLAGSSFGQPKFKLYPDSIRVELPEQNGLVVFELREFTKTEALVRDFPATLTGLLDHVRRAIPEDLNQPAPMYIEVHAGPEGMKEVGLGTKPFGERKQITIQRQEPPKTRMTILGDRGIVELLPPGWEIKLVAKAYQISVYAVDFPSLEKVAAQDFSPVADAIKNDVAKTYLGRKSIEARMILRNQTVDQPSIQFIHPGDQIFMTFQAGVGLYQNVIYPELSFKMGLSFRDRMRRPNFRTSLVATRLFFAEQTAEGFKSYPNTFLSGTFEVNFDRKSGKASWSGLGLGFLVDRNGNYFQGNTGKFFITHTIPGSRFSMVPEFYLTDDFKKFTFGMTLKYSF